MSGELTAWRGKQLEEMTREELIAVVRELGGMLREHYTPAAINVRALGRVEMLKRGTRWPLGAKSIDDVQWPIRYLTEDEAKAIWPSTDSQSP